MSKTHVETMVEKISKKLQELENLLKDEGVEKVNIQFPRGVIRKANDFRNRLEFIDDDIFKTNVAYSLMLTDVYRWILNRFDIGLTAQEMLIKEGISLLGNIIEAILRHIVDKEKGFKSCCSELVKRGIINSKQKEDLIWLWNMRCKQHLATLPEKEYRKYTLEHYNKAIILWKDFETTLRRAYQNGELKV